MDRSNAHRVIEETALRSHRRHLTELLLPAAPPIAALGAALFVDRLPLEVAVASGIALAMLVLHASGIVVSKLEAAEFLDRSLGAKDHFLTLATVEPGATLLPLIEAGASAILGGAPPPELPRARRRPLTTSVVLSILGFLVLWVIPQLAPIAAAGGGSLETIAAELAASGDATDQELARLVRDVSHTLHDPERSNQEKRDKIHQALAKLDEAERKRSQTQAGGSSAGEGEKGERGRGQKAQGEQQGHGQGQQAGGQNEAKRGSGNGAGNARGQAKQELQKLDGELAGESAQAKNEHGNQQKPQPSGGGIQGPESGAKERKSSERDGAGNQPGKAPDKSGGNEKPGGTAGQAKSERGNQPQPNAANTEAKGGGGGAGEGGGQRPSTSANDKPAERYYKPGEAPGGKLAGGEYVRVRVPEENRPMPGTEEVAKPGEVSPEVAYGNAPLPEAGPPGEVGTEQPVPLEYRDALKPAAP